MEEKPENLIGQEHLNEVGHSKLADIIYNKLVNMNVCCAC